MTDQNTTDAQESQQTEGTAIEPGNDAAAAEQGAAETGAADTGNASDAADVAKVETPAASEDQAEDKGELQRLREALAGGDEGMLKALERYKSVDAISKAFREARTAAKNAGKPLTLSEKASEEEIKAYRDAMGIPDDAKDYPVSFRDDFQPSEADAAILDSFKEYLHGKNADPRAASAALEWYQDFAQAQKQELSSRLAKTAKDTQAALRAEWGGEYDGNIGAAGELMKAQLGEEGFASMMDLRLMDGSRLQDNIAFVKMMAQLGSDYYGGNAIMTGDVETTSKTVQERIDDLLQLRATDSEKYFSDDVQGKLQSLYAQRNKLQNRK